MRKELNVLFDGDDEDGSALVDETGRWSRVEIQPKPACVCVIVQVIW